MRIIIMTILAIIFGLCYRYRGSQKSWLSTTPDRLLFWGLPCALACLMICYTHGAHLWVAILCGIIAYGGECIGHEFCQGKGLLNNMYMGVVGLVRISAILFPIFLFTHNISILIGMCSGVLWGLASWLSYLPFVQRRTLSFLGTTWCIPGDSTWEELFIGGTSGMIFGALI